MSYDKVNGAPGSWLRQQAIDSAIEEEASQSGGLAYKVYTALFSQSGTDVPVVTILEKTVVEDVVWTRQDIGQYYGTCAGFTDGKSFMLPFGDWLGSGNIYLPISDGATETGYINITVAGGIIAVTTYNTAYEYVDYSTLFGDTKIPIDVRVYP